MLPDITLLALKTGPSEVHFIAWPGDFVSDISLAFKEKGPESSPFIFRLRLQEYENAEKESISRFKSAQTN